MSWKAEPCTGNKSLGTINSKNFKHEYVQVPYQRELYKTSKCSKKCSVRIPGLLTKSTVKSTFSIYDYQFPFFFYYTYVYEFCSNIHRRYHFSILNMYNLNKWTEKAVFRRSGSTGSTCFWTSRIRIRIHYSEVWIRIIYHNAKIVRKTLIPTVLWLLLDFLYSKNDVNVPSKSNKQNFF